MVGNFAGLPWFLVNILRTWYFHAIVSIQVTDYHYKSLNIQLFNQQDDKQLIWVLRTNIKEWCKLDCCLLFLKKNICCGHYLNELFIASVYYLFKIRMDMIGPWFGQGTLQMANDQLRRFSFLNLVFSLVP